MTPSELGCGDPVGRGEVCGLFVEFTGEPQEALE